MATWLTDWPPKVSASFVKGGAELPTLNATSFSEPFRSRPATTIWCGLVLPWATRATTAEL
jgi:hypothetical protein